MSNSNKGFKAGARKEKGRGEKAVKRFLTSALLYADEWT